MLLALLLSFLQPSGLPDCNNKPNPRCDMPDIPSLRWEPEDRRYSWPLEVNDPPLSVKYHRNVPVYGEPPEPNRFLELCVIDEARSTADCYSEWEYQTFATCAVDRWSWISQPTSNPGLLLREDPYWYHEHAGRLQVYLWEFAQGVGYLPTIGSPLTPVPRVSFQADRTQVIRRGPSVFFGIESMLFIRENDSLFRAGFDYNSGETNRLPASVTDAGACSALFIFETNWCEFAPWRPECPR